MHDGCKTGVEKAWLVTGVTSLVLHRLLEAESSQSGMWLFEWMMIILTFPFGPVAMLFLDISVEALSSYTDVSWLLDWSTLLFVGYIQWFVVLPEIRRSSKLVTLNLTSPAEIAPPVELASPIEIASPAEIALPIDNASPAPPDDSSSPPKVAPVAFNAAAFLPPLAEFDEAGLSALDRVLRAPQQTSLHALQVPPSCDEVIFPSVSVRSLA